MALIGVLLVLVWIWALVDVLLARGFQVGPRWLWALVVALGLPPAGVVVYLLVGKQWGPDRSSHPSQAGQRTHPRRPLGPDDDPDFLSSL